MKKRILLLTLCIAGFLALTGCGNQSETEQNLQEPQQQEQQQDPQGEQEENQQQAETSNIKQIAGKKPEKVAEVLGQPMQMEGDSYFYPAGVQVDYVQDKAAVVTIIPAEKISDTDFEAMFEAIGLKAPKEEAEMTEAAYVWKEIDGFAQITVYRSNGFVDYYHIVAEA